MRLTAILGIAAMAAATSGAATLQQAVGAAKLPGQAAISSYVTVFNELEELDDAADRAWKALPDRAAYDAYRRAMHANMMRAIGPLPERTPLNARTVATYTRKGYRIEKVIFESMPGLYVTANLFIPTRPEDRQPLPAIVMSCGHADEGKDCDVYLRACVIAAQNGFVALMFDPYEQGERRHFTRSCSGHNQIGTRAALLGWSMPLLRIWDGMRAVDYVLTRPEVDANRVGYMGQSGGGTMTALMTAADLRLKATAPSCYLTSLTSLCEHMGPQDAEQNIFGQLRFGLNHTGYVLIPDIPVAVTCKFSDLFTYYGTRRLYRTVQTVARMLGEDAQYMLNDAPGPHGWTEATEQSSVAWMRAWLKGEKELLPLDMSDYRAYDLGFSLKAVDGGLAEHEQCCSPTRFTKDLPGSRTIYEIMRARRDAQIAARQVPPAGPARAELVRRVANMRTPTYREQTLTAEEADGCTVRHVAFLAASGLALPAKLVMRAGTQPTEVVLAVSPHGMTNALAAVRGELDAGKAVLLADVLGTGSIGKARFVFYGTKVRCAEGTAVMLYLMGESLVGRQASDLVALGQWAKKQGFARVALHVVDNLAIAGAHAHAAAPELFAGVTCSGEAPLSWSASLDAAHDNQRAQWYSDIVPNALAHYDWVDLLK